MGFPTTLPETKNPSGAAGGYPDRNAVHEQLDRILANPLFTSSKRYPGMLRYVVEHALNNPASELKERTIGIEVFGREPSYDTNHDPVVRTSAVEIRKRLIQYYHDPARDGELRIELVVGSYIPRFRSPSDTVHTIAPVRAEVPAPQAHARTWRIPLAFAIVLAVATLIWFSPWNTMSSADRFWAPVWDSPDPVLIGLSGGPGPATPAATDSNAQTLGDLFHNRADYVPMGDAAAMARILSSLRERGKPINLVYSSSIQLADLKSGPAILIGPVNRWLEMMAQDLRFTIQRDDAVTRTWISDRQHPDRRDWSVQVNAQSSSVAEAYALISRVWNPTTGRFMVCISGLSPYATSAAGEFVSNTPKMAELLKSAPSGWSKRNVQIVIAATRVGTNVGIPRAVATYFW